jgi:hypothetical protein
MDDDQFPRIVSFVIRFVQERPTQNEPPVYRGIIRQVQTDQELTFTDWEAAQGFMEKFVKIKKLKNKENNNAFEG